MAPKKKFVPLASMPAGAARTKRILELAANAGTRAKIPTNLLPAQYKAGRIAAQTRKQENATLYNPSAILTGNNLRNAVNAEVNLELSPKLAAIGQSIKSLTGQRDTTVSRANQYFQGQQTAANEAVGQVTAAGKALTDQTAALNTQAQQRLDQIGAGVDKRAAEDAALRGQDASAVSTPAQQALATSKANAVTQGQAYQQQAANVAAAYGGIAGTAAATAPNRAMDSLALLGEKFNAQIREQESKKADLESTRGDLTTKTLNKMRNDQFTNLAVATRLQLSQDQLDETIRNDLANNTINATNVQADATAAADRNTTAAQRAKDLKAFQDAQIQIKRGIDPVTGKRLPRTQSASDALNQWKLDFARKHGYLPPTGPSGVDATGKPLYTQEQKNKLSRNLQTTRQTLKNLLQGIGGTGQDITKVNNKKQTIGGVDFGQPITKYQRDQVVKKYLQQFPGVDTLFLSAALDMAYFGGVRPATAAAIKNQRGLTLKDLGLRPARSGASTTGRFVPGAGPAIATQ